MLTVFISYSRSDQKFAERLHAQLNSWGYDVWIDVKNIRAGDDWRAEIDKGLISTHLVIGILSPDAMKSVMVKYEWDWSINNGRLFIPLYFRHCEDLSGYSHLQYVDFRDDEQVGFQTLHKEFLQRLVLEHSVSLSAEVQQHVEKYWQLARKFFELSDYALAAFFALVLFDEIGSTIAIGFPHVVEAFGSTRGQERKPISLDDLDRRAKQRFTVGLTLQVNSRVTRVYGDLEGKFARWFREDAFPSLLHHALHLHGTNQEVIVPEHAITKEDAFILTCMVGEIYADVQGNITGVTPNEWQRIVKEVDEFRERYALD